MRALPKPEAPKVKLNNRGKPGQKRKPGGGRKPGIKAVLSAEIAQDASLAGITPVEILLHHARYSHQRAIILATDFEKAVVDIATTDPDEVNTALEAAMTVMKNMQAFSHNACLYANMAAPYCHSRLNAITVDNKANVPIPDVIEGTYTQDQVADLYRKLIR
jgi:hypothetical protein